MSNDNDTINGGGNRGSSYSVPASLVTPQEVANKARAKDPYRYAVMSLGADFRVNLRSSVSECMLSRPLEPYKAGVWYRVDDKMMMRMLGEARDRSHGSKSLSKHAFFDEIDIELSKRQVDTFIEDYLERLPKWDGVERLESIFSECFLVDEDYEYLAKHVVKHILGVAVMRAYEPGAKADESIAIFGRKRIGKSTFVRSLVPRNDIMWFSDSVDFANAGHREMTESLSGVVIAEVGEMSGMNRADTARLKRWMTSRGDTHRMAYGRSETHFPHRHVLVCTANELVDAFSGDEALQRRFVVVEVLDGNGYKISDTIEQCRGQLWAEALFNYKELGYRGMTDAELDEAPPLSSDAVYMSLGERMMMLLDDDEIEGQTLDAVAFSAVGMSPDPKTKQAIAKVLRVRGFMPQRVRQGEERVTVWSKEEI